MVITALEWRTSARETQHQRESAEKKIAECDVFLSIVGPSYGSYVPGTSKSYSEFEYDIAVELDKPRLVLHVSPVFPVPGSLREPDEKWEKQKAFQNKVKGDRLVATFADIGELKARTAEAISNLSDRAWSNRNEDEVTTVLLFAHVTQQGGFDTGLVISNIAALPKHSREAQGSCAIHYYGTYEGSYGGPTRQHSDLVQPGHQLIWTLFAGGVNDTRIFPTPGFVGYIVVECRFPARGFAFISDLGAQKVATCYLAEVLPELMWKSRCP